MPRIAVAVGVVALMAFSIGLNTVRYRVVWDMVGGTSRASLPGQPLPSAAAPRPAAVVPLDADRRAPPEVGKAGTNKEDPHAPAVQQPPPASGPPTRGSAGVDSVETPSSPVPLSQVTRAEPPDAPRHTTTRIDPGGEIRRLPPLDQVAPHPASPLERSPQDPIPIYPSSGT